MPILTDESFGYLVIRQREETAVFKLQLPENIVPFCFVEGSYTCVGCATDRISGDPRPGHSEMIFRPSGEIFRSKTIFNRNDYFSVCRESLRRLSQHPDHGITSRQSVWGKPLGILQHPNKQHQIVALSWELQSMKVGGDDGNIV